MRIDRASSGERCPICGKPAGADVRPFCSSRCADIDLGRWLSEAYTIPSAEEPDEEDLLAAPIPGHRQAD